MSTTFTVDHERMPDGLWRSTVFELGEVFSPSGRTVQEARNKTLQALQLVMSAFTRQPHGEINFDTLVHDRPGVPGRRKQLGVLVGLTERMTTTLDLPAAVKRITR